MAARKPTTSIKRASAKAVAKATQILHAYGRVGSAFHVMHPLDCSEHFDLNAFHFVMERLHQLGYPPAEIEAAFDRADNLLAGIHIGVLVGYGYVGEDFYIIQDDVFYAAARAKCTHQAGFDPADFAACFAEMPTNRDFATCFGSLTPLPGSAEERGIGRVLA